MHACVRGGLFLCGKEANCGCCGIGCDHASLWVVGRGTVRTTPLARGARASERCGTYARVSWVVAARRSVFCGWHTCMQSSALAAAAHCNAALAVAASLASTRRCACHSAHVPLIGPMPASRPLPFPDCTRCASRRTRRPLSMLFCWPVPRHTQARKDIPRHTQAPHTHYVQTRVSTLLVAISKHRRTVLQ
jgi:hypothetical protein